MDNEKLRVAAEKAAEKITQELINPILSSKQRPLRDFEIEEITAIILSALGEAPESRDPHPYGNQHFPYCARHQRGNYDATLLCTCHDYPLIAFRAGVAACVLETKKTVAHFGRDSYTGNAISLLAGRLESLIDLAPSALERSQGHPEDYCHKCGRSNIVWFAPSPLWNKAVREKGEPEILCPVCFVQLAEAAGIQPTAWQVAPESFPDANTIAAIDAAKEIVATAVSAPPVAPQDGEPLYSTDQEALAVDEDDD